MANPFITTADPMQQTLVDPEAQALQRQKQYAAALLQQSQQPQGQMIGNRYVAPSWTQQLNAALNPVVGAYMMKQADTEQEKLAEKLRLQNAQEAQDIIGALTGKQGETVYGAGEQGPTKEVVGAVQANPQLALAKALSARGTAGKLLLPSIMEQVMPKEFDLNEGQIRFRKNPETGQIEKVAAGGEKYHAPIAVDTGTGTVLLDPKTMQPVAKYGKSVAGHVLETDNGPMLVDTRTGKATPVMANGQPLLGGKPLTEGQGQATGFGIRAAESDKILTNLENQGVTNTGKIRSGVSGILGGVPLVGEKLESGTYGAMNMLPGVLGGPNAQQQQTDQARRNFVTAVLRKESGASISPSEFANEERKYFPQAGDTDAVIKQKQDARKLAIKSLEVQAGSGAKQIKEATADQSDVAKSWLQQNPNHPLAGQVRAKLKAEGKL